MSMYKSCSRTQHSTQSSRSQPLSLSLYKLFSLKASSEVSSKPLFSRVSITFLTLFFQRTKSLWKTDYWFLKTFFYWFFFLNKRFFRIRCSFFQYFPCFYFHEFSGHPNRCFLDLIAFSYTLLFFFYFFRDFPFSFFSWVLSASKQMLLYVSFVISLFSLDSPREKICLCYSASWNAETTSTVISHCNYVLDIHHFASFGYHISMRLHLNFLVLDFFVIFWFFFLFLFIVGRLILDC